MLVTILNPRITVSADVKFGDATVRVTVLRSAGKDEILSCIASQVNAEAARVGFTPPTDEELAPALAIFGQLAGEPREVDGIS